MARLYAVCKTGVVVVFLLLSLLLIGGRCDLISNTTVILPVQCYKSIGYESLSVSGDSSLCENNICKVNWQVEVDWETQDVVSFQAIFENNKRCMEAYGVALEQTVSCTVTNFGDTQYNTMDVQIGAFYENSNVHLVWKYRGANVSCEVLAQQAALMDKFLLNRDITVSIGAPYNEAMKLTEAMSTPLGAFNQECPLRRFDCQCTIGCVYMADEWASSPQIIDAVWGRIHPVATDALIICGLDMKYWLAESRDTKPFPTQIRSVLKEYSATTLNVINFGCDHIMQSLVAECYDNVTRDLLNTKNPQAECHGIHDWAYVGFVLSAWNSGNYLEQMQMTENADSTMIPCSCATDSCAQRFMSGSAVGSNSVDPLFISHTATVVAHKNDSISTKDHHFPQHWDDFKLLFFILMLVFGTILLVIIVFIVFMFLRRVGPTRFRPMGGDLGDASAGAGTARIYAVLGD